MTTQYKYQLGVLFFLWGQQVELFLYNDAGERFLDALPFVGFDRDVFVQLLKSHAPLPKGAEKTFADALTLEKERLHTETWMKFYDQYHSYDAVVLDDQDLRCQFEALQTKARAVAVILLTKVDIGMDSLISDRDTPVVDLAKYLPDLSRDSQRPTKQIESGDEQVWKKYLEEIARKERDRLQGSAADQIKTGQSVLSRPAILPPARIMPAPPPRLITRPDYPVERRGLASDAPSIAVSYPEDDEKT